MAGNRITLRGAKRGRGRPRIGRGWRAIVGAALLVAALTLVIAGCGGGADSGPTSAASVTDASATPSSEQAVDGEILNTVVGRQEAAVTAYAHVIPKLAPRLAHMAAYFRAQEQEHVDAVLKAMRGLKSNAEATGETIDVGDLKTDRERLEFLYEIESATIDEELSAISSLESSWPRSLLASTVANQGQHLTLLRQALGAGPLASVPKPFENGTAPPPE